MDNRGKGKKEGSGMTLKLCSGDVTCNSEIPANNIVVSIWNLLKRIILNAISTKRKERRKKLGLCEVMDMVVS